MPNSLYIALVQVQVVPGREDDFRAASLVNARESRREPGVVRFDVVQDREDPSRFILMEIFRDAAGAAAHRDTPHYQSWRDTVAPMMAEPRTSRKYVNVSPDDAEW